MSYNGFVWRTGINRASSSHSYSYDGLGRRSAITRGNGVGSSIGYDAIGRLTGLTHDLAGTANDVNWTYAYNPASQITGHTRSNDLYAWTGHFNVNRSYGTNGLNQLTSAGGTALGYDARGNLTSSGATAYTYTVENRLSSVSGAMTAGYDTLGRLAEYNTSVSTRFLYDGDRVTAELDNQGAVNPVKRRYVWGAGEDELIAWYEGIGSTTRRFAVQDERASIVAVSDSAGSLVGINRYDEYGIPAPTNIGRFQYTGQAFLAEAGLHHYKARAYSPTLGRFMQTDPIGYGDGINWYAYVDGDPVNRSDPSGLAGCIAETGTNICSPSPNPTNIGNGSANAAKGNKPQTGPLGRGVGILKKAGKDTLDALEKTADAVLNAKDDVVGAVTEDIPDAAKEVIQSVSRHAQGRIDQGRAGDARRDVGDRNRVVREGRAFRDTLTGNTVYIKGNRAVFVSDAGVVVSVRKMDASDRLSRIRRGRLVWQ